MVMLGQFGPGCIRLGLVISG